MNEYERDLYLGPIQPAFNEHNPRHLAWLAGFTDGEGTISLSVNTHKSGKKTITPRFSLSNTTLANLGRARFLLVRMIGHDVKIKHTNAKDLHRKPAFAIELASHLDVDIVLRQLYPYLVGKWKQAHIVLEYLAISPGHPSHPDGYRKARGRDPVPGRTYDDRHWELVRQIRKLNRRYAYDEWRAEAPSADEKPGEAPGYVPMDPLKRWYKLLNG